MTTKAELEAEIEELKKSDVVQMAETMKALLIRNEVISNQLTTMTDHLKDITKAVYSLNWVRADKIGEVAVVTDAATFSKPIAKPLPIEPITHTVPQGSTVVQERESEKAIMYRRSDDKIAWVPKSVNPKISNGILVYDEKSWLTVEFKEDNYNKGGK